MTEWAYPNPGTPRGRVNSPLHIVRYIMKEQPSYIRSLGGSVGSTLAFLQTISDQTIFCSAVRIPNAPHPFHVFESFQGLLPFVVLDSFMKHFNPQQWVSFQKTHFFVIVLQEITFKAMMKQNMQISVLCSGRDIFSFRFLTFINFRIKESRT